MFKFVSDPNLLIAGLLLALAQCLAALPWLWSVDPNSFRKNWKNPQSLGLAVITVIGLGAALAAFIGYFGDSDGLRGYGRWYAALLHLQLLIGVFILGPRLFGLILPKTGAVALAAYREGWRQPMFWLIGGGAALMMLASVYIPYYTFGDDYKMMKMIGFDIVMLASALFGILAASLSISEEIEGRTAITVMSKPINRRSFLIGKYLGILMACGSLALLLAWMLNWTLLLNAQQEKIITVDDKMTEQAQHFVVPKIKGVFGHSTAEVFSEGIGAWTGDSIANTIGVTLGFGQVMILVAIATALATRLAFVVNILITMVIYFLGNLAPVVVKATDRNPEGNVGLGLIRFFGKVFDTLLPALEHFQMNTAVVRENPLDLWQFGGFVLTVLLYSLIYTTVVLLVGLLLFENRDLA